MLRALRRATHTTCSTAQRRRAFFSLPSVPSTNANNEPGTQRYRERKVLPYQRSELYNVIADVESYSKFVPYCADSRVLKSKVSQDGITVLEAELAVGFLAFRECYVSTVTCRPHESVEAVVSSSAPLFKTLTTVWRLQPIFCSPSLATTLSERSFAPRARNELSATMVTLDLAFAFANPTHATVSAAFFGQVSKLMVKAFEQRCAALYGTG